MLNIRSLSFNPLQERCYVAWREAPRCAVPVADEIGVFLERIASELSDVGHRSVFFICKIKKALLNL